MECEDAPAGHDAHSYVVARGEERAVIKASARLPVMQVTTKQAGSLEQAMRLCRLCYVELANGKPKDSLSG